MKSNIIKYLLCIAFLFHARCGVLEPEQKEGSLIIYVEKSKNESLLKKISETLSQVECIVKKGRVIKYQDNLTHENGTFHGKISGLKPGSDYSVILYGKNSSANIIARDHEEGIAIESGNTRAVTLSWHPFCPELSSPDNQSFAENQPTLQWEQILYSQTYQVQVSKYSSFSTNLVDDQSVTDETYIFSDPLDDGTYYWRVRCSDSEGNWGGWSDVWTFEVQTYLSTPANFNASDYQDGFIQLSWDQVSNATYYKIYRDTLSAGSYPYLSTTYTNNYTDDNVDPARYYYYKVKAFSASQESGYSGSTSGMMKGWRFSDVRLFEFQFRQSDPDIDSAIPLEAYQRGLYFKLHQAGFKNIPKTAALYVMVKIGSVTYHISSKAGDLSRVCELKTFTPTSDYSYWDYTDDAWYLTLELWDSGYGNDTYQQWINIKVYEGTVSEAKDLNSDNYASTGWYEYKWYSYMGKPSFPSLQKIDSRMDSELESVFNTLIKKEMQ